MDLSDDKGMKFDQQRNYPLVMTNIAMENGPLIVDVPIEHSDFP